MLTLTGPCTHAPVRLTHSAPMRAATMTPTAEMTATPHSGNLLPLLSLGAFVGDGDAPPPPRGDVGMGIPPRSGGAWVGAEVGGDKGADVGVGGGAGAGVGGGAAGADVGTGTDVPPLVGGDAAMVALHSHFVQSPFHRHPFSGAPQAAEQASSLQHTIVSPRMSTPVWHRSPVQNAHGRCRIVTAVPKQ